ncbi:MAG: transposase [Vicinamibacterales bacterium]
MARPKRLVGINYTGFAAYFVTCCTHDRRKTLLDNDFCGQCRDELFAASREFGFSITAYCLMPDHVHQLVEATREDALLTNFVASWKQRTGFAWGRRSTGTRLWQKGYWDRVLRDDDNPLSFARYVVENPVRAKLVGAVKDYPWVGSDRYSLDEILAAYQLDLTSGWHR